MHEASKRIIIGLIVVLLGIIFYETGKLMNGLADYSKFHNDQINDLEDMEVPKKHVEHGKYTVRYNELLKGKDQFTILEINDNGTYKLKLNLCEGVYEYQGNYKIKDDVLVLNNINNTCSGFTNCEKKEFTLYIMNSKILNFNEEVACLGKNSKFVLE